MYVCIFKNKQTHIHTHTHTHTHKQGKKTNTFAHAFVKICIHAHTHTRATINTHTHTHTCMHTHLVCLLKVSIFRLQFFQLLVKFQAPNSRHLFPPNKFLLFFFLVLQVMAQECTALRIRSRCRSSRRRDKRRRRRRARAHFGFTRRCRGACRQKRRICSRGK